MIIARDKATLAFELAALATEREKCLRRMELNNQVRILEAKIKWIDILCHESAFVRTIKAKDRKQIKLN